jgi:hypothetical protein
VQHPPPLCPQAFHAEHPGLLDAIAAAAASLEPPAAARLLRRLEAELPPALTQVAPGGDCVLVAVEPGLLPLLGEPTKWKVGSTIVTAFARSACGLQPGRLA